MLATSIQEQNLGRKFLKRRQKNIREENRLTATKKYAQAICRLLENKAPALGKDVTQIPITYYAVRDPTKWGNLLCKYGSISMNILQQEFHKSFSNLVATVDVLPTAPLVVRNLDLGNIDASKKLFYSRGDSQVVAELIKNILTDAEYSNLMLKIICLLFRMIPPATK